VARDTFEVTVKGGGDPETFVAKEVDIVVNGREHFVVTPSKHFGLMITAPTGVVVAQPDGDDVLVYEAYH
jgi:hypothetical protein